MILKKGDYVNLSGCILQEKKEIYDWLISEGNKFNELINGGVEYIECSGGVGVLRQVDLCERLLEYSTNNRTEELLTLMKQEKEMNKFDNTYINTSGYTKEQILPLAEKYSKASGININSCDIARGNLVGRAWKLMACHKNGPNKLLNGVFVTDWMLHIPESATEITEQDLDDYLEKQEKEMKELPEEFIIVNADNMAVREWLDGMGYKWSSEDSLTELGMDKDTLCHIKKNIGFTHKGLEYLKAASPHLPIITPRLGVTGFDIETPNPNQTEIERMKKNIEELQASIAKLEGK